VNELNRGGKLMATGNEGASDTLDQAADASSLDQDNSAFIAELTRRVVHEHELATRRERVFQHVGRHRRPPVLSTTEGMQ